MSTTNGDSGISDLLSDTALQAIAASSPTPVVASADSFMPFDALQHLIDSVHTSTGFSW